VNLIKNFINEDLKDQFIFNQVHDADGFLDHLTTKIKDITKWLNSINCDKNWHDLSKLHSKVTKIRLWVMANSTFQEYLKACFFKRIDHYFNGMDLSDVVQREHFGKKMKKNDVKFGRVIEGIKEYKVELDRKCEQQRKYRV
jgi:hypothetical protein